MPALRITSQLGKGWRQFSQQDESALGDGAKINGILNGPPRTPHILWHQHVAMAAQWKCGCEKPTFQRRLCAAANGEGGCHRDACVKKSGDLAINFGTAPKVVHAERDRAAAIIVLPFNSRAHPLALPAVSPIGGPVGASSSNVLSACLQR